MTCDPKDGWAIVELYVGANPSDSSNSKQQTSNPFPQIARPPSRQPNHQILSAAGVPSVVSLEGRLRRMGALHLPALESLRATLSAADNFEGCG